MIRFDGLPRLLGSSLLLLAALAARAGGDDAPAPALRGLDPVALVAGRETPGDVALFVDHGGRRYLFSDPVHRNAFLADPGKFSPRFDGACMKMGPLSGRGDTRRFAIHDGAIYALASDACLARFTAEPEKYIDRADPPLPPVAAPPGRLDAIFGRALRRLGGRERFLRLSGFTVREQVDHGTPGKPNPSARETIYRFPGAAVHREKFTSSAWGWEVNDGGAWLLEEADRIPAGPDTAAFMAREALRHPWMLLRAWLDGRAAAQLAGVELVNGSPADGVTLHSAGVTATLFVDRRSGRITRLRYRGRSDASGIGVVERDYLAFARGPLALPTRWITRVDGEPLKTPAQRSVTNTLER